MSSKNCRKLFLKLNFVKKKYDYRDNNAILMIYFYYYIYYNSHQKLDISGTDTSIHSAATVLRPGRPLKLLPAAVYSTTVLSASSRANKQVLNKPLGWPNLFGREHKGWIFIFTQSVCCKHQTQVQT